VSATGNDLVPPSVRHEPRRYRVPEKGGCTPTFACTATALPPRPTMSAPMRPAPDLLVESLTTTEAPSPARCIKIGAPIPPDAPVTTATVSASFRAVRIPSRRSWGQSRLLQTSVGNEIERSQRRVHVRQPGPSELEAVPGNPDVIRELPRPALRRHPRFPPISHSGNSRRDNPRHTPGIFPAKDRSEPQSLHHKIHKRNSTRDWHSRGVADGDASSVDPFRTTQSCGTKRR
jgi:hypothetical protein